MRHKQIFLKIIFNNFSHFTFNSIFIKYTCNQLIRLSLIKFPYNIYIFFKQFINIFFFIICKKLFISPIIFEILKSGLNSYYIVMMVIEKFLFYYRFFNNYISFFLFFFSIFYFCHFFDISLLVCHIINIIEIAIYRLYYHIEI